MSLSHNLKVTHIPGVLEDFEKPIFGTLQEGLPQSNILTWKRTLSKGCGGAWEFTVSLHLGLFRTVIRNIRLLVGITRGHIYIYIYMYVCKYAVGIASRKCPENQTCRLIGDYKLNKKVEGLSNTPSMTTQSKALLPR